MTRVQIQTQQLENPQGSPEKLLSTFRAFFYNYLAGNRVWTHVRNQSSALEAHTNRPALFRRFASKAEKDGSGGGNGRESAFFSLDAFVDSMQRDRRVTLHHLKEL